MIVVGVAGAIVVCVSAVIIPIVSVSNAMRSSPPLHSRRFWVLWGLGYELLMIGIAALLFQGMVFQGMVPELAGLDPSVREVVVVGGCLIVALGAIVISIAALTTNGPRRNPQA